MTGFYGGAENQGMTTAGHSTLASRTPRNVHSLIAHEAAHHWFGDSLSPYTWADIRWNEGFATYLTEVRRTEDVGPEPLGRRMEALRYTVLSGGRFAPAGRP